jgi:TonB-linked SusC/RagA family outer membrane protein
MRRWILVLAALCAGSNLQAQTTGRITGHVAGEGGVPVSGAYVAVVGIDRSATTDSLGMYLLVNVPPGMRAVRARLVGYTPQTLRVNVVAGQTATLHFTLGSAAVQLEGMTVVAYGEQERRDIVGSVSSVPIERIADVPTMNAIQAIQNKVAGVDIVGSNYRPGASMNIRIRGVRSMVATNEPLFVVDGIPIAGGIEDFDPANIESIEVLKDASATAAYGSRGANGVVLLTTRRGGTGGAGGGGTRITYDVQYGFQNPLHLVSMMDTHQYTTAKIAAWLAASRDTSAANLFPDPNEFAVYTAARANNWQNYVSTDWQQVILRTGRQARHQLGINTISGSTRLSLTGSYFNQAGITIGQGYQMYSGTASLDHTTGPLHVGLTVSGTRSHTDVGYGDGLWGQDLSLSPMGVAYDSLGLIKWKPTNDPLLVNPLSELEFVRQLDRNRLFGSVFAELAVTKDFTWRINFGPDQSNNTDGRFRGTHTIDRNGTAPDAYFERQQTFAYTLDNMLRFNREFSGQHRVEATALYSIQHSQYTMNHAEAANLPYDQQQWYNLGTGEVVGPVSSDYQEWALAGWMGRVNYVYADRYMMTVTGRYDGSSRLAAAHRWAFFPSVGLGWQLGEEPFFRRAPLVSQVFNSLKVRGSWGVSGNTGINPYQTEGSLSRTRYNFGANGAFGYAPGSIPNPDLVWEKTASVNVGVDFGIAANRITGSLEVYRERTSDLLMAQTLPATSGFTSTLRNIGKTANDGWEFNISTVNLPGRSGGPRWTSDISLTHNKNYIVSLYGKQLDDQGNRWFIGQPINVGGAGAGTARNDPTNSDALRNVFYDYKMLGIWQLADSAAAAVYGQKPGDIRVQDVNGDGKITAADRFLQGNTYPKLMGSFYNRVTWGPFDASVLLTFRLGYTIYDYFGVGNSVLAGRYNNIVTPYWTPENCPLSSPQSLTAACNTNPRPNGNREDPQYSTARGYVSGGHARIRNITIGYTLPASVARYFQMQSVRLYMQAQDPFLFSNYKGYDPEAGTAASPPSYRTIVFGTTVGF